MRISGIGILLAASLLAGCAGTQSVQGVWGSKLAGDGDCKAWSTTITAKTLTIKVAMAPLPQDIDLKEDSRGADVDVYLLGRDLSRKLNVVYPIRLSVQNGEMTFSSDDQQKLGQAWLKLLQVMQPLHRCPSS